MGYVLAKSRKCPAMCERAATFSDMRLFCLAEVYAGSCYRGRRWSLALLSLGTVVLCGCSYAVFVSMASMCPRACRKMGRYVVKRTPSQSAGGRFPAQNEL